MLAKGAFHGPSTPSVVCRRCLLTRKLPPPGKPPILPPSKQQLYNVQQPHWQNPADVADLLWRRHTYNNALLSMRHLFREEIELKKKFTIGLEDAIQEEAAELDTLLALNEQRNQQLALEREEREKAALQQLELETRKLVERRLELEQKNVEERTQEVLEAIERSKTEFVTRENLEKYILDALERPTTFDYAIDLNGTKIENPMPDKYPHSVSTLPNLFESPLDFGPSAEGGGYKYKKGPHKPRPPKPMGSKAKGSEGDEPKVATNVG